MGMFKALLGYQVNKYCTDILCKFIISYSDHPHTTFWLVVRTHTRTELWRCVDYRTRTASTSPKTKFF